MLVLGDLAARIRDTAMIACLNNHTLLMTERLQGRSAGDLRDTDPSCSWGFSKKCMSRPVWKPGGMRKHQTCCAVPWPPDGARRHSP